MDALNSMVLYVVSLAIFLYLLYFVIRSGVRDGIRAADEKREAGDRGETTNPGNEPKQSR